MNTRDKCLGTLVRENRTRHAEREREREGGVDDCALERGVSRGV